MSIFPRGSEQTLLMMMSRSFVKGAARDRAADLRCAVGVGGAFLAQPFSLGGIVGPRGARSRRSYRKTTFTINPEGNYVDGGTPTALASGNRSFRMNLRQ
jgi:hypothetical protein